jgi:plasmid stabilization system protein ParE
MAKVIWSPPALRDMQRLHRFLAERSPEAASRAVKALRGGVKVLSHQPEVGRPAQGMDPGFREWPVNFGDSGYLILYRFDGRQAVLLAVRHQRELGG